MNVGLLFPGEMGAEVGAAVRGRVLWASEGRSPATVRRAADFEDVRTLPELVALSEIILSVCPPEIAEQVALEVAGLGFHGLYVEANAISPERVTRIAKDLDRVVDGAIIGRSGTHLYLSGDASDLREVAALFAGSEVEAIPLEGGIGSASALKMAFAGWNKIGSALVAQAHAIARAYGVEAALEAEGVSGERLGRVAARAWRWRPEMDEIGDTCAALGLPDGMARGAAELFGRWSRHRDDETVELRRLLDDLSSRPAPAVRPPPG